MSEFGDTASGPSHFVPQVFFFVPQGMPGPPGEKGEVGDVGSMVWTMGENGVVVVGRGWPLNQFGGVTGHIVILRIMWVPASRVVFVISGALKDHGVTGCSSDCPTGSPWSSRPSGSPGPQRIRGKDSGGGQDASEVRT